MEENETIVAAAIKIGDDLIMSLPKPARHADIHSHMNYTWGTAKPFGKQTEGFLTSTGRFVDRWQARIVALRAEQITQCHSELYTDDVW